MNNFSAISWGEQVTLQSVPKYPFFTRPTGLARFNCGRSGNSPYADMLLGHILYRFRANQSLLLFLNVVA